MRRCQTLGVPNKGGTTGTHAVIAHGDSSGPRPGRLPDQVRTGHGRNAGSRLPRLPGTVPAALTAALTLPRDADLPLASRARNLADVAYSHSQLGHDGAALTTFLTMEQMAPDWITYHTLPRQIVAELLERQRRVPTPLRQLARRLSVTAD